jgi:hypothetical protein
MNRKRTEGREGSRQDRGVEERHPRRLDRRLTVRRAGAVIDRDLVDGFRFAGRV